MRKAYFIHALSALHAGTGQAISHIDLPIARYRSSGIPFLPGSSVKGVLRDALSQPGGPQHEEIFGRAGEEGESDDLAGAVSFGDARLLAMPVRSLKGTFAWVTSPLLLRLARRDLGSALPIPSLGNTGTRGSLVNATNVLKHNNKVFFEDVESPALDLPGQSEAVNDWATLIASVTWPDDPDVVTTRFVVTDDETMSHIWEHCTQIDARIRIGENGVVEDGALWYEESLPAESLLIGIAEARPGRRSGADPDTLLTYCLGEARDDLQFGGKATIGRGRVRLVPAAAGAA